MANNEILLDLLEAGEFERAKARRRLVHLGGQVVRRQGGQSRRRRGVEMGQRRQAAYRSRSMATTTHARHDHRAARADLR